MALILFGQNDFLLDKYRLSYQKGTVFPTNTFLKGQNNQLEPVKEMSAYSFSFGKQTIGKHYWQENYQYPYIGGGIYVISFGEHAAEFGTPIAAYGFISAPFVRRKKWAFNYDIQLGLAFNWNPYNPISNPNNISIGAKKSVYIDLGAHLDYQFNDNFSMELGATLSHFSNGALKKPNFGLNTFAPRLSIAYQLDNSQAHFIVADNPPKFQPKIEWNIHVFAGLTNVIFDSLQIDVIEKHEGVNFPTFGISSSINRQISPKSKIGVGFTLGYHTFYHAAVSVVQNDVEITSAKFSNKIAFSVFPSYELVIDRLSIIVQPGFYLYRSPINDNNPLFYQRLGVKYHLKGNLYIGVNLRAFNLHVSDFIEWNVGYRLDWD